jgi:biopolymer transport protein ExbB
MLLLQVAQQAAGTIAEAVQNPELVEVAAEPAKLNFFEMALKGGWIMIPLLLLLIVAIYIFFERMITLRKASKEDNHFMNRVSDYIYDGKIKSALDLCKSTDSPTARMVEKGISRLGRPMNDILVAIENVGNMEIAKLEKGLNFEATIAGGAPMLGFLGTVLGMVEAFFQMEQTGSNTINLSTLSGGIYTAMVTTVAGLIVGVIAYFAYNYLVGRVDEVMQKLEVRTMEFLDLLNEPASK